MYGLGAERILCLSFEYKLDTEYTVSDSALSTKYGVAAMYRDLKEGILMSEHEFYPISENALLDKTLVYKTALKVDHDFFKPLELEMREYLNNGIRMVKDYTKCLK